MIRVLAIDDEPLALRQLATYIKKVEFLELAGECQSAPEAKEIMDREPIDALFIDINMPDANGMDFVKSPTYRRWLSSRRPTATMPSTATRSTP